MRARTVSSNLPVGMRSDWPSAVGIFFENSPINYRVDLLLLSNHGPARLLQLQLPFMK